MTAASVDTDAPVIITEPGIYDLDELTYHGDPVPGGSLSHSSAKLLLQAPALFKYQQDNPPPPKRQYDLGHAAHKEVLGVGLEVEIIDADSYRSKAAQDQQKAAHARGAVPLLRDEWATVQQMAAALRQHPLAAALLAASAGTPEASAFARDEETGVMLRARFDHLPHGGSSPRFIIVDYKTCISAEAGAFGRSAATYGYPQQHAWYVDVARALNLADDIAMLFVAQEKTPPYLVNVIELPVDAVDAGRERNRRAIERYVDCTTSDQWPGYADGVVLARVPRWYLYDLEEDDVA